MAAIESTIRTLHQRMQEARRCDSAQRAPQRRLGWVSQSIARSSDVTHAALIKVTYCKQNQLMTVTVIIDNFTNAMPTTVQCEASSQVSQLDQPSRGPAEQGARSFAGHCGQGTCARRRASTPTPQRTATAQMMVPSKGRSFLMAILKSNAAIV